MTVIVNTTDPVCGMRVDPGTSHFADYNGNRYGFCSAHCAAKFRATPLDYLVADDPEQAGPQEHHHNDQHRHHHAEHGHGERIGASPAVTAGTKYTCPMHPEIVRDA